MYTERLETLLKKYETTINSLKDISLEIFNQQVEKDLANKSFNTKRDEIYREYADKMKELGSNEELRKASISKMLEEELQTVSFHDRQLDALKLTESGLYWDLRLLDNEKALLGRLVDLETK
jgi:hypothetical protein